MPPLPVPDAVFFHSIQQHSQKDEIIAHMNYGRSCQAKTRPLFKRFVRILNDHHIPWSIGFGTLLGCIRHGAEIPWDDDYDIHVLKTHVHRLRELHLPEPGDESCQPDFGNGKEVWASYSMEVTDGGPAGRLYFVQTPWHFLQVFFVHALTREQTKILDIFHESQYGQTWISEDTMFPLIQKTMSGMNVSVMHGWRSYLEALYSPRWFKECVISNRTIESVYQGKTQQHICFEILDGQVTPAENHHL